MKKSNIESEKLAIIAILSELDAPLSIGQLSKEMPGSMHIKTLQRRLADLTKKGLVLVVGDKRNTRYYLPPDALIKPNVLINKIKERRELENYQSSDGKVDSHPIFSSDSLERLTYLKTPPFGRVKSTYQFDLVDCYIPNETQYVPNALRNHLLSVGKRFDETLAAGTYAKEIGQRLLIDLSYNSSRLEGNTYTKLDTQNLIEHGVATDGKIQEETVMIMNHKEAIQFLVENAEDLTLTSFTIRNIHHLLSQDLIMNPEACGNIRQIEVTIGKSAYLPLANPYQLTEYLALLLRKANQIENPFEQSFFLLLHISYLQAFEDVNKRTARLSCNIPFIKHNLCPLSFIDVPQEDYFKALLYFYETNDVLPALELFEWAYLRSCEQYDVVKESLGEIDTYRVQYRSERKSVMGAIIRERVVGKGMELFLLEYCETHNIESPDKFISMTLNELQNLHSGAIIGLMVTEKSFKSWKSLLDSSTL